MKRLLLFACILVVLSSVSIVFAQEHIWIAGRVVTNPQDVMYGTIGFYRFNFTILESNSSLGIGDTLTVIVPRLLSAPVENNLYNFSGYINPVQVDEIPAGVFIVTQVHGSAAVDYMEMFKVIIDLVSGVMRNIVDTICQLIHVSLGIAIPPMVVTILIMASAFYFLLKYYKVLGLIFVLALGFIVTSGFANLLSIAIS